jgi:hypothetical protein
MALMLLHDIKTNLNIGVQIVDEERVISVTIDGIVRTFSISERLLYVLIG